jgi:hypothetical protein
MADPERPEVTLKTLHEDLAAGFGEMRAGFADLKTALDIRIREQHLEAQQVLRALIEGQRLMIDGQRLWSDDLRALIARIDALIRGRGNGHPTG